MTKKSSNPFFINEKKNSFFLKKTPLILLGLLCGIAFKFAYSLRAEQTPTVQENSYSIELTLRERNQAPIPQVEIYHEDRFLGLTDSFGSFSRFMNLSQNSSLVFLLKKKTRKGWKETSLTLDLNQAQRKISKTFEWPDLEEELPSENSSFYDTISFSCIDPEEASASLVKEILPFLRRQAVSHGLKVDPFASWHVALDTGSPQDTSLKLRLVSNQPRDLKKMEFMVSISANRHQMVREIFKRLMSLKEKASRKTV